MSQANVQPISNFAQFNRVTTVTGDMLDTVFGNNSPYTLVIDGQQVFADPRRKGEPGDIVVIWPKKRGPRLARKLACHELDGRLCYLFMLDSGTIVAVPYHRVVAIHRVVDQAIAA